MIDPGCSICFVANSMDLSLSDNPLLMLELFLELAVDESSEDEERVLVGTGMLELLLRLFVGDVASGEDPDELSVLEYLKKKKLNHAIVLGQNTI